MFLLLNKFPDQSVTYLSKYLYLVTHEINTENSYMSLCKSFVFFWYFKKKLFDKNSKISALFLRT